MAGKRTGVFVMIITANKGARENPKLTSADTARVAGYIHIGILIFVTRPELARIASIADDVDSVKNWYMTIPLIRYNGKFGTLLRKNTEKT